VLIGDVGLVEQPMLTIAGTASNAKPIADGLQNAFFKTIDRLFMGNISAAQARAAAWGVQSTLIASKAVDWSKNGSTSAWLLDTKDARQAQRPAADYIVLGADVMDGGVGNDLMFGDMAAVMPVVSSTTGAGMIQSMRVLPVGETGATLTATLRYVYNYGAFGPLHGASATDVNTPSLFKIDADRLIGGDGDDVLYGLLGDDYLSAGIGNDQLSGGNGFDTVNGGTGTNTYAFDRTRDKVEAGGGQDIVRQTLDASSSSLVLGQSWISPLMAQLGGNARTAAGTLDPTGLNAVRPGTAPAPAAGVSTTPKVINAVARATVRPSADMVFVAGFDETTLPTDDVAPFLLMAMTPDVGEAPLFTTFAAPETDKDKQPEEAAPATSAAPAVPPATPAVEPAVVAVPPVVAPIAPVVPAAPATAPATPTVPVVVAPAAPVAAPAAPVEPASPAVAPAPAVESVVVAVTPVAAPTAPVVPAAPATAPAAPTVPVVVAPAAPAAPPATPAAIPAAPAVKPAAPAAVPATTAAKPVAHIVKPVMPAFVIAAKPARSVAPAAAPAAKPAPAVVVHTAPAVRPATPAVTHASPVAKPAAPAVKTHAAPSELISGIRKGDIAIKGTAVAPMPRNSVIQGVGKISFKVADRKEPEPYMDLDVLFFDGDTGAFVTHADADDDIGFH